MTECANTELRGEPRDRRCDAFFWRRPGSSDYEMGWALESSDHSAAFAWRGDAPPKRGDRIEIQRKHNELPNEPGVGIVRRVRVAHNDLVIVAVELVRTPRIARSLIEALSTTA